MLAPRYNEYCCYNRYIENFDDELSNVFSAIDVGVHGLNLPIHMIHEIQEYIPRHLVVSTAIDYPSGYSSTKARISALLYSVKSGANAIDYTPNNYLVQLRFTDFRDELNTALAICNDYGCSFRLFLCANRYPSEVDLARYYAKIGVEMGFPSIGYHREDFIDTMLWARTVQKATGIDMIFTGYIHKPEQLEQLSRAEIFGCRLYSKRQMQWLQKKSTQH